MAWTKVKTAILVGAGILLATATTTVTVKEIREHRTYPWQVPEASFDILHETPSQVRIVPTKFAKSGGTVGENDKVLGIAQPVKTIVQDAYRSRSSRMVIPAELPKGQFDYIANLPQGAAKALQREVERRFGLVGKRETREVDVLLLKVKNPNIQGFKPANSLRQETQQPRSIALKAGGGQRTWFDAPVSRMKDFLEDYFETPVIDQSGVTGHHDFTIAWDEPDRTHPNSDALKQALLDQFGLELVRDREPVEMLVVETVK